MLFLFYMVRHVFTCKIHALTRIDGLFYTSCHVNWNFTCNSEVRATCILPPGGGRGAPGVQFFSESLIFRPIAHFLQDFHFK